MTCECCGGRAPNLPPEMPDVAFLAEIGAGVLNHVAVTLTLGHTTPADSLVYIQHEPDPNRSAAPLMVRDFVAWSGRRGDWKNSAQQLTHYVKASGWQRSQLERVARELSSP